MIPPKGVFTNVNFEKKSTDDIKAYKMIQHAKNQDPLYGPSYEILIHTT